MDHSLQIQKLLLTYFKDTNDETVMWVVNSFAFENAAPGHRDDISDICEKFLKDNELVSCHLAYITRLREEEKKVTWFSSNGSLISMWEDVKRALLVVAFSRFRGLVIDGALAELQKGGTPTQVQSLPPLEKVEKPEKVNTPKVEIFAKEEESSEIHYVSPIQSDYTLCSMLIDGDYMGKNNSTTKAVNCKHCQRIKNYCRKM
jgi:hypothetical protein